MSPSSSSSAKTRSLSPTASSSAWLAARWEDPAFPAAFPWFDTHRYWEERILELREQIVGGERTFEEAKEGETYHRIERSYGLFERTFSLPNSVDPTKIEARFKDGEMNVVLPRREESKPRSVKIKVDTK